MLAFYWFSDSYTSPDVQMRFTEGGISFIRGLVLANMLIVAAILSGSGDILQRRDDCACGWRHQHV